MISRTFQIAALVSIFILASCSSAKNPVSSGISDTFAGSSADTPVENISNDNMSSMQDTRGVFGAWKITVNTDTLEYEISPSRNAKAIGDTFDADLSQFLIVSPCSNCLQITKIWKSAFLNISVINLDVAMRHPFGNITSRPDLHGFDVRAIVLHNAFVKTFNNIDVMKPGGSIEAMELPVISTMLYAADGYTSHYDNLVTDDRYFPGGVDIPGNVNAFFRYFDDFSNDPFDPHNPSGHNVMPVGSDPYIRSVCLPITQTTLEMYIIADVAYGQSAVLANRQNPQYYLPAFNRTEPWRVEYWIENNNLDYTDNTSTADVVVQVFDWQQNATPDPAYPDPLNPTGVRDSSKVKEIILSAPDLQMQPIIANIPDSGTGTPTDPLQYRLTVTNVNLYSNTNVIGMLAVRDELCGEPAPKGRFPIPDSPSGFPYQTDDILDYSLYFPVSINMPVTPEPDLYENEIQIYSDNYDNGGGIQLLVLFFMDWLGRKFQYEWDFDYDGITFDADGTGMPSPLVHLNKPGLNNTGLRIRTNTVPPREYIYNIPAYKTGIVLDEALAQTGQFDTTGRSKNNSIDTVDDRVYVAYTSSNSGVREVYVTYYAGDGSRNTLLMSPGAADHEYYDPSICIKKTGTHRKVYMVYTDWNSNTNDSNIMFSVADLNLASSIIGTPVTSAASSDDYTPCIVRGTDTLWVYFVRQPMMGLYIIAGKSTDGGQTWTGFTSVDSASLFQDSPCAVYNETDRVCFCAWRDSRDYADRGYDIYIAKSVQDDGLTFNDVWNISRSTDKVHEVEPSISANNTQIAIAYLSYPDGSSTKTAHFKLIYNSNYWTEDYAFINSPNSTHTTPFISQYDNDNFIVGYGVYNETTSNLQLMVMGFDRLDIGDYQIWSIGNYELGNVSPDQSYIYPGIAFRTYEDTGITEQFFVYRQFNDGIEEDTTPNTEQFGKLELKSYMVKK